MSKPIAATSQSIPGLPIQDPAPGPTPSPLSTTTTEDLDGKKTDTTIESDNESIDYAYLCEVCKHINFQAIFTPREYDRETQTVKAIYRPELNGTGKAPIADWNSREARRAAEKAAPINLDLPKIRTANFEDAISVCDSESEDYGDEDSDNDDDYGEEDYHDSVSGSNVGDGQHGDKDKNVGDNINSVDMSGPRASSANVQNTDRVHVGTEDDLSAEVQQRLAIDLDAIKDDDDEDGEDNKDNDDDDDDDDDDDNDDDDGQYDENDDSEEDIGSIDTWSGTSHFTENERIDLNKQAAGNWNYFHGQLYYLGSIWDVRSRRRRCDLCDQLWHKMINNADVRNRFLTKSRCVLKLLELKGRRSDGSKREVTMLNMIFIYGYKVDDPIRSPWIVKNPVVINGTHHDIVELDRSLGLTGEPLIRDDAYGEGRWRSDECDFNLFRRWLDICQNKHNHPRPEVDDRVKIRLIDVKRMCLVELQVPASQLPQYAALSYVWGVKRLRVILALDSIALAKVPSYFEVHRPNKTIINAITVVEKMGLPYLWVDSLCIVQDSDDDKREQIPQMLEIYRRATFTIVAAFGEDVDAGLPGISKRTGTWFSMNIKGMRVQFRGSCKMYTAATLLDIGFTENYIRGCPYLSRAWTFQEGLLSPRLLIFTTSMVYWECERCTWCEDAHWESDAIDFIGLRAIKNSTPTDVWNDRFERKAYDLVVNEEEEDNTELLSPKSYPAVIREYTSRNLTWDMDILHACDGVLTSIKESEQCSFVFGLRTTHFANDLLFSPLNALPLRFPNKTSIESGFPTWSWTAWSGAVDIANEARNNSFDLVENLVPCDGVKCFMLQIDERDEPSMRLLNHSGGWRFSPDYVRCDEGIYDLTHFSHDRRQAPQAENQSDVDTSLEIPEYDQDIVLSELESHPAFSKIVPNFHIVFNTFSTLVVVRLEYDELNMRMANVITGGTKMARTNGIWGNRDTIQRKVYACRKIADEANYISSTHHHHHHQQDAEEPSSCSCCGKDTTPEALPQGYELGPYLGRLPALSACWDTREYLRVVPDGLYKMLWMNNNQLPMFGHLLCKPMSDTASIHGQWDGEILQRVCGVVGPTEILTKERQRHYCAEWGMHILG